MAVHISGSNISICWLKAINFLVQQNKYEVYNLLVEIANPLEESDDIRKDLETNLLKKKLQPIDTVANTIFPQDLYFNSTSKDDFFKTYKNIVSKLKKSSTKNSHGIYFERLTSWPYKTPVNQIDNIINRLKKQIENSNPNRVIYEALVEHPQLDAAVYTPGFDNNYGFPCLSFLSFKLEGNKLNLTAIYRNHYFFERAYGNYVGLGRLLNFICKESGLSIGNLCVLSTHGELETGVTEIKEIVKRYKESVEL